MLGCQGQTQWADGAELRPSLSWAEVTLLSCWSELFALNLNMSLHYSCCQLSNQQQPVFHKPFSNSRCKSAGSGDEISHYFPSALKILFFSTQEIPFSLAPRERTKCKPSTGGNGICSHSFCRWFMLSGQMTSWSTATLVQ